MKYLPYLVGIIGALMLLYGVMRYCGAQLPYQDATPALLALQRDQIEAAKWMAGAGLLAFIGGLVWAIVDSFSD